MAGYYYGNPWSNRSFNPYSYSKPSPQNFYDYPYSYSNPNPTPVSKPKVVSIPVHYVNRDSPVMPPPVVDPPRPSPEMAALRLQKVTRGFLVRKNVKTVRKIEMEVEEIGREIAEKEDVLEREEKSRIRIGEMLMRLMFKLDSVRGVRDYRKKVIKRVISLQEKVDSIGSRHEIEDQNKVESSNLEMESDKFIAENSDSLQLDEHKMEEGVNSTEETPIGNDFDPLDSSETIETEQFGEKSNLDDEVANKVTGTSNSDAQNLRGLDETVKRLNLEEELDEKRPKSSQKASDETEINAMKELMERIVKESETMKLLIEEMCQRQVQQSRFIEGLVDRVHRVEKAVDRMERREKLRKRKGNKGMSKCKQWNSS